ncbi:glutamate synthase large subunit [Agathobacter ruminis]|uniref:Glutamate synthase large subunit n=1 Tax=Agathobacter ruminis TaxID=1712665 RepID=A0A2G3E489_9FIRM|nr:glutamate synthase large subunit [Agathobacter ruminis]MDC7301749.1 glutamate synthase large subunit [Agathobacter ruminis]PHU37965.1 glutamate synthase large subunit [Agathobacter ruminis]
MKTWMNDHDACGIGAVINIDGHADHRVLDDALSIVEKLEHRAGKDASGKVGDGVGILVQISHDFFARKAKEIGIELKNAGDYGIGMFYLPQDAMKRMFAKRMLEVIAQKENLHVLGWRDVEIHPEILGEAAKNCMPYISQCFIERPEDAEAGMAFERRLYCLRREYEKSSEDTYICSFSSRTIVYKGMFLVGQLRRFYEDLMEEDYKTAIALVHSRFSTNTTPSWQRAHPYRMIAHNGEINTIRGNSDRMLAREETMSSEVFGGELGKVYPVIASSGSDSAMLDNTLEFLYMNGMPLPLAMMLTIPEPWTHNDFMAQERKDFYHYYATMMEPWDGPAAVLFTDGELFGATLDRNGLRPSRYYVTKDGRLILASEVGVLDIPDELIECKSRLSPGHMLLVDTVEGRIISDEECKERYAKAKPYGEWLDRYLLKLDQLSIPNRKIPTHSQEMRDKLYKVFGYSYEDVKEQILPMAMNGVEPTVSMGTDVPLAMLSGHHQPLFCYFKQLFAQVTNPPIDSLREKVVTDTTVYIGSDGNLLKEKSDNCRVLEVQNPILTGVDLMKMEALDQPGFRVRKISLLYYKNTPVERALEQLNVSVDRAVADAVNIIILSDRGVDENHMPIPSLLAVSSVEQHLVQTKRRTAVSIILESAEPRDVHQIATLLGFGARAIHPYLAHECISELIDIGILDKDYHTAIKDYNKALLGGVVKIAAKMGISTLQSYQSARIFEAIGLSQKFVDRYFTGITSRVGGIGIEEIGEDVELRHNRAFDPLGLPTETGLDSIGFHSLRNGDDKEDHMYSPKTIVTLQRAVREGDYERFKEYAQMVDDENRPHTLRALLSFVPAKKPVPIEEIESEDEIVKRFQTGAMSYGSLSKEAHETLAIAMNRLGGKSNTGEGGEDVARFGTERNSAVKQVASGRFGVTSRYLQSASEIQIKMAQGAKPGEGGHLPGKKVYPWVAGTRFSTPGVALISPPPHHDIYSIEDLAQLIYDLKNANDRARISVKLVSEAGVGTIASGVAKAGAQVILVSGYDGGTGAAPSSSVHHAGLPWELGVSEAHQSLMDNGLRSRVVLETDGKLMTGRDVAIAALLGAEEFGFATAPLVCMGCMMMRVCSKDTCPVGIATQNETLRKRFCGKPEYVMNFMHFVARQLREIMSELGFRTVEEMVGHTDSLCMRSVPKARCKDAADLSRILDQKYAGRTDTHFDSKAAYNFELEKTLDAKVLIPAYEKFKKNTSAGPLNLSVEISSTDRSFGTLLGSKVTADFADSLADDSICVCAHGGGGQSFGAFLPKGVTLRLDGDANDGFGKGLSGGKLIVKPSDLATYPAHENIIIGNVALYGATAGKAYVCGIAGERFCVRNSGAVAVAEGCGDHGLEYMTGGRAVILGMTGKNFAAGMSGGIAYVLDREHTLYLRMNKDMASLCEVTEKYDIAELRQIIEDYVKETGSQFGREVLDHFEDYIPDFKKIVPNDYQKMLTAISKYEEQGIDYEHAVLEAFKELTE